MRRKDKEIIDKSQIYSIINRARVCRLGLSDDNNTPYVIPLNFGFKENVV